MNCVQDIYFGIFHQICFLAISFSQNMECLGKSTCMLTSNSILQILFTGDSDIFQQHAGSLQVKLL